MTRKRFIKLHMGRGLSRNGAQSLSALRPSGVSYTDFYAGTSGFPLRPLSLYSERAAVALRGLAYSFEALAASISMLDIGGGE